MPLEALVENTGWWGPEYLLVVSPKQEGNLLQWAPWRWTVCRIFLPCKTRIVCKIISHYVLCLMKIKNKNKLRIEFWQQRRLWRYFAHICGKSSWVLKNWFCNDSSDSCQRHFSKSFFKITDKQVKNYSSEWCLAATSHSMAYWQCKRNSKSWKMVLGKYLETSGHWAKWRCLQISSL